MKKNGFTLVELLAVILLLTLIITLFIPNALKLLNENNLKVYKIKEEQLVKSAKDYTYDSNFTSPTSTNPVYITITDLSNGNYLDKILDASTGNECIAFVKVTLNSIDGYDFEPCIICDEYKTDNNFCSMSNYQNL